MENKVAIIDEIIKRHPSYGVERGWSEYTGGMKDSGSWFFRKMLDEPVSILQSFLDYLISEENRPVKPSNKSQEEMKKDFFNEIERRLLWGKK